MLFVGCPTGVVASTASSHVASRAVRKPASCVLLVLLSVQRLVVAPALSLGVGASACLPRVSALVARVEDRLKPARELA